MNEDAEGPGEGASWGPLGFGLDVEEGIESGDRGSFETKRKMIFSVECAWSPSLLWRYPLPREETFLSVFHLFTSSSSTVIISFLASAATRSSRTQFLDSSYFVKVG